MAIEVTPTLSDGQVLSTRVFDSQAEADAEVARTISETRQMILDLLGEEALKVYIEPTFEYTEV